MVAYPAELTRRFSEEMKKLRQDVARLKTRTAGIDSGMPLAALPAQINPAYTSGDPRCLVNGSATLSGPYQYVTSYTPAAGDMVLLVPTPVTAPGVTSYVIIGKLSS